MRIINRKDFLKMPSGTFFRKVEHTNLDELAVKLATVNDSDFYIQTFDWIDADGMIEESEEFDKAYKDNTYEIKPDFEASIRDGCFDEEDQMFAVYSTKEILELINILKNILDNQENLNTISLY